ncbi:heparinase [Paraflavitalea soli]|uniref:Heparinase n=2 Tax=Paraflavitalea soli TaxID=2315862 RepID=A0A3B7MIX1_9BACT|nr:heparinase [Paraflavitalea soli]
MCCMCSTAIVSAQSVKIDTSRIMGHPRLLLLPGQEEGIKKNIASNIAWGKVHADILEACDSLLDKPALERVLIGRRLLDKSREALRRIFFLSYAWRMSGKKKYFRRCEEELLAISAFTDWNPSHFLDVAEMTMAAGIGYDWLYKDLSPASRQRISEAVITKGLTPSLEEKYNGWLRGKNNWNQVCNAGISFGAAAVYESRPALAAQLIERAIQSVQIPMKEYAPDGNYTEGYSYWAYGTSYNVFLISLLEQLFGTDYSLSQLPGFLKTPFFYEHVVGLSGKPFNYSDCGDGTEGLQPAMFWFANKLKDPSVLWQEKDNLEKGRSMAKWNRFLPAAMIWGKDVDVTAVPSPAATWVGDGENPVALLRTSWNKQSGIFIGFKGGTPAAGHGHMDAGSFVLDAEGVRWSADLGMQGYESLESKGLQIWDMGQASDRWKVFRYSNFSHSTITVNKALQQVNGRATFLKHSGDSLFTRAVMDLGSLYAGSLTKAVRGIAIANKQYVTVRDEWEAGDSTCTVRWAMLTPAHVVSIDKNQVQLQNNGKKLTLYVNGLPEGAALRTWPTDPPNSYDALNIGTVLVGFEMTLPAHTKKEVTVLLVPGEGQVMIKKSSLLPLSEW